VRRQRAVTLAASLYDRLVILAMLAVVALGHEPVACMVKDRFPLIDVTVEPAAAVQKARVYFRTEAASDYHSVDMTLSLGTLAGPARFSAKLPKPKEKAGGVVLGNDGTNTKTPEISAQVVKRRDQCPEGGLVAAEGGEGDVRIASPSGSTAKPDGFSGIARVIAKAEAEAAPQDAPEGEAAGAPAQPQAATQAAAVPGPPQRGASEGAGAPAPGAPPTPPAPAVPSTATARPPAAGTATDYVVGNGDILRVTVYGHDDLTQTVVVQADGSFVFPLIGRVKAGDLTTRELERKLGTLLSQGFIRNPQIAVLVQEYRSKMVFVVGELAKPGTYSLADSRTVVELLAKAGPLTQNAGAEVVIVRPLGETQGPTLPPEAGADPSAPPPNAEVIRLNVRDLTAGNLDRNVELRPNDTVFVPQAARYFVSGEVRSPGSFPLTPGLTVAQAIIVAGGYTDRAATGRLRAIRQVEGKSKEFKVKPDDPVQPGDTIVVKEKLF
jgi:polysaccharide export outer membrane protein